MDPNEVSEISVANSSTWEHELWWYSLWLECFLFVEQVMPLAVGITLPTADGRYISLILGQSMRRLVKDGFVIRKPVTIHSRARARA